MYIVKSGTLFQTKIINTDKSNKWPHREKNGTQKWRKLLVQKQVQYTIEYKVSKLFLFFNKTYS